MWVNFYQTARHNIQEEITVHRHHREILKSHRVIICIIWSLNNEWEGFCVRIQAIFSCPVTNETLTWYCTQLCNMTVTQYHIHSIMMYIYWQEQEISLLHNIPTGSGAHPASHTVGTRGCFPRGKTARGVKLTTHLHIVLRLTMVELCLHSCARLYGVVRNFKAQG
jgi:membrane-bound inhibitor of C-type lysozyme